MKQLEYDLYYYERSSGLEIDFIITKDGNRLAIEVKSSDNVMSKSLQTLMEREEVEYEIRLSSKNISSTDRILRIPLYLSIFL